ncbi:MAG: hypothetical protein IT318_20115 [Anaerolineales bacterium]|nr:hypothetical protein [Anaerolineales bacterium]
MSIAQNGPEGKPLSDERLAAIQARCNQATPGPWGWRGNGSVHQLWLNSLSVSGGMIVMTFARWGMQQGQPVFNVDGILHKAEEFLIRPQSHNPWLIVGVDHPDARFMEEARSDVPDLLAEVRRLRIDLVERDAAIALADDMLGVLWSKSRRMADDGEAYLHQCIECDQWERWDGSLNRPGHTPDCLIGLARTTLARLRALQAEEVGQP